MELTRPPLMQLQRDATHQLITDRLLLLRRLSFIHFYLSVLESRFMRYFLNPYPTAFPYGNGMVLHFYQQQESSTTKTVHKVINKGLKGYV